MKWKILTTLRFIREPEKDTFKVEELAVAFVLTIDGKTGLIDYRRTGRNLENVSTNMQLWWNRQTR